MVSPKGEQESMEHERNECVCGKKSARCANVCGGSFLLAAYNVGQQRHPVATSIPIKHSMFGFRVSSSGMRFAPNEYSDEVGVNKALYKEFARAKPASVILLQEEKSQCQKLNRLGRSPNSQRSWVSIGRIRNMCGACKPRARRSGKAESWSTLRKWWRRGWGSCVNVSTIVRSQWR